MITDTELFNVILECVKWGVILGAFGALWFAIMK